MFSAQKLLSLPYKTRLRKLVLILQKAEIDLAANRTVDTAYLYTLLDTVRAQAASATREQIAACNVLKAPDLRALNRIRYLLLHELGCEPAEWDFVVPDTGELDSGKRTAFPARVFLEEIRSPFNVGSLFRTAECFGVEHIYLSETTPLPTHKKAARTARNAAQIVPWSVCSLENVASEFAVFALETGGIPVTEFPFPQKGIVLIGSEELGLSPEALQLADRSAGRAGIPLFGAKHSLNVAVAFGILMEHWSRFLSQQQQP